MRRLIASLTLLAVASVSACGSDGGPTPSAPGSTAPNASSPAASAGASSSPDALLAAPVDPARFVPAVDNSWMPLTPGVTLHYRGTSGGEPATDTFTVTSRTRVVDGVTCTVVHDVVHVRGVLAERTEDWYAQDVDGNVWYFGERTAELNRKGRVVTTEGSWEAGVDGAKPGIFMPANPTVGQSFPQEQFPGQAEDWFVVMFTGSRVKVPADTYRGALITGEWTPLEPGVVSQKAFAKGIGEITERDIAGGDESFSLVKVTGP